MTDTVETPQLPVERSALTPAYTKALGWMLLSAFGSACMVSLVRYLTTELPSAQVVFLRNGMALLLFLPWVLRHPKRALYTKRINVYALRAAVGLVAMQMWFYALSVLPLPMATSLSFTSPLLTAILAAIYLGERYSYHRWMALFIGFLGTLVILHPWSAEFNPNALIAVASAMMWAISGLLIKSLSVTDHAMKVSFMMVLLMTPLSFPFAVIVWEEIPNHLWLALFALGLASNVMQVSLSKAIAIAPFYIILPVDFTRLLFVCIIAYFAFGELMSFNTFCGAVLIMGAAFYSAWRDALRARFRFRKMKLYRRAPLDHA